MTWRYSFIPKNAEDSWYIIIHHSLTEDNQTVSWNAIKNYHINELKYIDIGYHFGIELINDQYQVLTGRPIGTMGAHTTQYGMNRKSIGICFVGNYDLIEVPDTMYNVGCNLIAGLCYSTKCSPDKIFPHKDYAPYKTCPGIRFDIERIKNTVKQIL